MISFNIESYNLIIIHLIINLLPGLRPIFMTSNFKRKSKSLPQFRKKIYAKISKDFNKQNWKIFIQNEIDLAQIVQELSKAQFDISNQNQMKYSVRQNLLIKKQIIKKLQTQEIEEGLMKLRQLGEKIPLPNEAKRIQMMIVFLEGRAVLKECIAKTNQEYAIVWLKNNISQFLDGSEVNFIKVKLLTLLSILLLKFNGILMVSDEKKILYKTIELKKKKLILIDSKEEKQMEFQSLLYILSEFYKILFLLKKDQQIIYFYYNQLAAYTEAYAMRQNDKTHIDLKQIDKILNTMKPILHNLNIYQDSKLREQFAFANIQAEIAENQHLPSHILRPDNNSNGDRKFSNYRISTQQRSKTNSSCSIVQSKKLIIQRTSKLIQLPEIQENDIAGIELIQNNGIGLSSLMMAFSKLYLIQLEIVPRNCLTLIDINLYITNQRSMRQIYRLTGVQTQIETLTLSNLAKFIEKLIKKIFDIEPQFRELHNLQVSNHYVPQLLDHEHIVPALIRSKTFIKEYLQRNYTQDFVVGNKFIFPKCTLSQIKNSLLTDTRERQMRKEKGIFLKRKGQLQNETKVHADLYQQVSIRFLFKEEKLFQNEYFAFTLFYNECFKGIDIYCFNDYQQTPDLTDYIQKFKQISQHSIDQCKSINKELAIQSILMLHSPIDRRLHRVQEYSIQEQLQSPPPDNSIQTLKLKRYNSVKYNRKKQQTQSKQYQVVKTIGQQYYLFVKQCHSSYVVYHNEKAKIYLDSDWRSLGWNLEQKRLRMYSGIKIVIWKNCLKHFLKTSKTNRLLAVQQQQIALRLTQHRILRNQHGYCIVQEYQSQTGQSVYEVIVDTKHKYFCITFEKIYNLQDNLNLMDLSLSGYKLDLYTLGRKTISQANHYFLQTRRGKFRI